MATPAAEPDFGRLAAQVDTPPQISDAFRWDPSPKEAAIPENIDDGVVLVYCLSFQVLLDSYLATICDRKG